jgi:hypothetical protein
MQLRRALLSAVLCLSLAACGVNISRINERPDKYYQNKVEFSGRVERTQYLAGETLLEVRDERGGRILVRSTEPIDAVTGDWVEVEGILVPEARVADVVVYDLVMAERVSRTRGPRIPRFM